VSAPLQEETEKDLQAMNQMVCRWIGIIAIALFLSILQMPLPARAHDGPPRLELTAERLNPGATLDIRGINIAAEQPVTLALIGAGAEYALGTVMGDEHGDFKLIVGVPVEAAVGTYNVRALAPNRVIVAVPLILAGSPISAEGGEQRDQDEPLLAPMPQPQDSSRSQPQPALTSQQPTASAAPAKASSAIAWWGAALAVLGVAAILLFVLRRRAVGASHIIP
jgi:hypothetical protein